MVLLRISSIISQHIKIPLLTQTELEGGIYLGMFLLPVKIPFFFDGLYQPLIFDKKYTPIWIRFVCRLDSLYLTQFSTGFYR